MDAYLTLPVPVGEAERVTARIYRADDPAGATLVLAHGAGGDQSSGFLVAAARGLAERGIDVATFNFLYTEAPRRRPPDRSSVLEKTFGAVVEAIRNHPDLRRNRLFLGGKSMGGRIATQIVAAGLEGVAGLVALGYPLHPPGRPELPRVAHLPKIAVPWLIVQGERDVFGTPQELAPAIASVAGPVTLHVVPRGDHSFQVPRREGPPEETIQEGIFDEVARWVRARASTGSGTP